MNKKVLICTLLCLVFLGMTANTNGATNPSPDIDQINGIPNTPKRRRISKQKRLQQKNAKNNKDIADNNRPHDALKKDAEKKQKKNDIIIPKHISVSQPGLASAFKSREDTESHLLRNPASLLPLEAANNTDKLISVNLDKTDLLNLLSWVESIFRIKFLSGDAINPPAPGKVGGNLISYKTNAPLTKRNVWDLFLNFLDLFGVTLVPTHFNNNYPDSFTVMPLETSNQAPLPAFVGINWKLLPNNDTKVRFVYFVENGPAANLANLVQDLKSKTAIVQTFNALNAIIFTDKSSNIRSLMAIISELDSVSMPEGMSVLKLRHANAQDVVTLYDNLVSTEEKSSITTRLFGAKKQSTAVYFPDDTKIFAEPRGNALIILGTREGIQKVENFILEYVDTALKQPYSPLYIYKLQYANAENLAAILSKVTNFAPNSVAAKYGGVLDGDKFLRPMTFIAEPSGNKLLIKAEKDDYLKVQEIIKKLDVKQPQVAIEVLIVNVAVNKIKSLGTQLRNKRLDTLGITDNIAFQTSGLGFQGNLTPVVTDPNGGLMGNLVSLATGFNPGTTLISIGSNLVGGVWALFQALETYAYTSVVSHPFLTTTNKYTAQVSVGETRRVATGTVTGAGPTQNTLGDVTANLSVAITPQINSSGIINLSIQINIDSFTNADATSPTKDTKSVVTNANLANNEILAIGGLIQDNITEAQNGVPLLERIPLFGWFFKNKSKSKLKDNLLIFISPQIVQPRPEGGIGHYTNDKVTEAEDVLCSMKNCSEQRDPIHRWFFKDTPCENTEIVENFINNASPCDIPLAYNCRTGQEYEADSIAAQMAIECPPIVCPNNYEDCIGGCRCCPPGPGDHVTQLCEPINPRPCQPISQCPESEYAPINNQKIIDTQGSVIIQNNAESCSPQYAPVRTIKSCEGTDISVVDCAYENPIPCQSNNLSATRTIKSFDGTNIPIIDCTIENSVPCQSQVSSSMKTIQTVDGQYISVIDSAPESTLPYQSGSTPLANGAVRTIKSFDGTDIPVIDSAVENPVIYRAEAQIPHQSAQSIQPINDAISNAHEVSESAVLYQQSNQPHIVNGTTRTIKSFDGQDIAVIDSAVENSIAQQVNSQVPLQPIQNIQSNNEIIPVVKLNKTEPNAQGQTKVASKALQKIKNHSQLKRKQSVTDFLAKAEEVIT